MRCLVGHVVVSVAVAVVLAGCSHTVRGLSWSEADVDMQAPRQVQPPGSLVVVLSPDGSRYAAVVPFEGKDAALEVREYPSDKLVRAYRPDQVRNFVPVVFSQDGTKLYGIAEKEPPKGPSLLVALDLDSDEVPPVLGLGKESALAFSSLARQIESCANSDWTARGGNGGFVSSSGTYRDGAIKCLGFDEGGALWFTDSGRSYKMNTHGVVTKAANAPKALTKNQTLRRGYLRIDVRSVKPHHLGADADLSVAWLVHVGPKKKSTAAFMFADVDVSQCCFVPKHDAAVVTTQTGSYFIPWTVKRKTLRSADPLRNK